MVKPTHAEVFYVYQERCARRLMAEDGPISGERLARRLGISRNSVWKAIEQLRGEGYAVEAVTNRGYRLVSRPTASASRRSSG